jgi:hypothetical protein
MVSEAVAVEVPIKEAPRTPVLHPAQMEAAAEAAVHILEMSALEHLDKVMTEEAHKAAEAAQMPLDPMEADLTSVVMVVQAAPILLPAQA